jgi:hypothetical protein
VFLGALYLAAIPVAVVLQRRMKAAEPAPAPAGLVTVSVEPSVKTTDAS